MDKRKYRFILLIVSSIVLGSVGTGVCADELKKPLIKLPQVNIAGQEKPDQLFQDRGIIPADMVEEYYREEAPKEETQGFMTGSYGSVDSKLFELQHRMKAETFYYNAYLKIKDSGGHRDNDQYTSYRPNFKLGIPFYAENELVFDINYFDKIMGLPGKTDMMTLSS